MPLFILVNNFYHLKEVLVKTTYDKSKLLYLFTFLFIGIFVGLDIYEDTSEGASWIHLSVEVCLFIVSSIFFIF
ncbi:MAG: hypothetical protein KDD45_18000, partial [Bdellovibrionales bacterium]|nr:hypothetical protein [Bdellovibrionales bacterium]